MPYPDFKNGETPKLLSRLGGLMTQETQLFIRCKKQVKDRFLELHEDLPCKTLEETLESLMKSAKPGDKTLRIIELEAMVASMDEAFRDTVKQNKEWNREAQQKVNNAIASRKAAHNRFHALVRHLQRNLPHNILMDLNLSKFMDQPARHLEPTDDVGEELRHLATGDAE